MTEMVKSESDVKALETTSTLEETFFVEIQNDEIKLENVELQGKLEILLFLLII